MTTLIDSFMHQKVVFIPWNFFRANLLLNVSLQYGIEPWYYYFTHTVIPLLNISSVPLFAGIFKRIFDKRCDIYLLATAWTLFLLSLVQHKEQRFLLPLIPILLCYAVDYAHKSKSIIR